MACYARDMPSESNAMIGESTGRIIIPKSLGLMCVSVLCGILVAGLWPFHAPKNRVNWLENDNGVRFGDYGTILSSGTFKMPSSQKGGTCGLEIWFQPALIHDTNTFLAFYTPDNPLRFTLQQFNAGLTLRSEIRGAQHQRRTTRLYVDDVFHLKRSVFITITSSAQGTAVYVDGALVRTSPQSRFSSEDFTGQLVIGTSPVSNGGWTGQLRGLAIYDQALTAAQVLQHYKTWTTKGRPQVRENERNVALYLFDERTGNFVHNQVSSGIDLYIPERFLVLDQLFLEPPWKEFRPNFSYCKNVLINIAGFIPLGFFFRAYLASARVTKQPGQVTIILGGTVSLTIEILQAYLPTRNSGMTDIITNTLGTAVGVMLCRCKAARALFAKIGIAFPAPNHH